eukprot:gene430-6842_t
MKFFSFVVLFLLFQTTFQIYKYVPKRKIKTVSGPQKFHVQDLNLVTEDVLYTTIVKNHEGFFKKTHLKHFKNEVLGYITPWNRKGIEKQNNLFLRNLGYEFAERFASKFNYLSPVWFNIKCVGSGASVNYVIEGDHEVNKEWIQSVRNSYKSTSFIKILPRFSFSEFNQNAYQQFFQPTSQIHPMKLAKLISQTCKRYGFDGLVFEWGYLPMKLIFQNAEVFLKTLSEELKSQDMSLILVIPAPRDSNEPLFRLSDLKHFSQYVTKFSLMTYDYSQNQMGPNSPLEWIKTCVKYFDNSSKLLIGLNFYGYDYSNIKVDTILGRDVVPIMKDKKVELTWDALNKEHHFQYTDSKNTVHTIYYPTLKSIEERLKFAEENNLGVAIWELGQGLDFFFDLF